MSASVCTVLKSLSAELWHCPHRSECEDSKNVIHDSDVAFAQDLAAVISLLT